MDIKNAFDFSDLKPKKEPKKPLHGHCKYDITDPDFYAKIYNFVARHGIGEHKALCIYLGISQPTLYAWFKRPECQIQETIDKALLDVEKMAKSVIIAIAMDPHHKKQYDAAKYLSDKADRRNGIADILIEEKTAADDLSIEQLSQMNQNISSDLVKH